MVDTLDAWEAASERAEVANRAVAEAALRHVATSVLEAIPDAVYLEVSFGSFGDGLVAESVHVDGEASEVSELAEDIHDALDDLNEYNAAVWMPFVVDEDEDEDDEGEDDDDEIDEAEDDEAEDEAGVVDLEAAADARDDPGVQTGPTGVDAGGRRDDGDGPPLLIDLTLVRETLGG